MKKEHKVIYLAILIFSILLYALPSYWGGYAIAIFIALLIIVLVFLLSRSVWKDKENTARINHLLWFMNSIVLFHFVLIYVYLIIGRQFVLIIGIGLGLILYIVVNRYIQNTF